MPLSRVPVTFTIKAIRIIVGKASFIMLRNSVSLMFFGRTKATKKTFISPKMIIAHWPVGPEKYRLRTAM
jgi:hypothetical protein